MIRRRSLVSQASTLSVQTHLSPRQRASTSRMWTSLSSAGMREPPSCLCCLRCIILRVERQHTFLLRDPPCPRIMPCFTLLNLHQTTPPASFTEAEKKVLTEKIQNAGTVVVEAKAGKGSATLSMVRELRLDPQYQNRTGFSFHSDYLRHMLPLAWPSLCC